MHPELMKHLKGISEIYWKSICALDIYGKTEEDAQRSITTFISGYAYERQGAPKAYPKIANKIISQYFNRKINNNDALSNFEKECKKIGIGSNRTNNIFFKNKGKITILDFMYGIDNIAIEKWVKTCIEHGKISDAHSEMCKIRGIGEKIASFYIRDIVYKYSLEKIVKSKKHLIHPIDIWVRRAGQIILKDWNKTDYKIRKFLVESAEEWKITNAELNAGLWILGGYLCKNQTEFESAIKNPNIIKDLIRERIKINENERKALKSTLKSIN